MEVSNIEGIQYRKEKINVLYTDELVLYTNGFPCSLIKGSSIYLLIYLMKNTIVIKTLSSELHSQEK